MKIILIFFVIFIPFIFGLFVGKESFHRSNQILWPLCFKPGDSLQSKYHGFLFMMLIGIHYIDYDTKRLFFLLELPQIQREIFSVKHNTFSVFPSIFFPFTFKKFH